MCLCIVSVQPLCLMSECMSVCTDVPVFQHMAGEKRWVSGRMCLCAQRVCVCVFLVGVLVARKSSQIPQDSEA